MYSATSYFSAPVNPKRKPLTLNKPGRKEVRDWLVVEDISGDFLGRSFRAFDLSGAVHNFWPDGIIFENKKTKERRTWMNDQFVILATQQAI